MALDHNLVRVQIAQWTEADKLKLVLPALERYIQSLYGDVEDKTGLGYRQMFIDKLEYAMGVKVVDKGIWDDMIADDWRRTQISGANHGETQTTAKTATAISSNGG